MCMATTEIILELDDCIEGSPVNHTSVLPVSFLVCIIGRVPTIICSRNDNVSCTRKSMKSKINSRACAHVLV